MKLLFSNCISIYFSIIRNKIYVFEAPVTQVHQQSVTKIAKIKALEASDLLENVCKNIIVFFL